MDNGPVPGAVLLSGVVGSTAYGLSRPDSDVDRLGVYAAPTIEFHGLHLPVGKAATTTSHNPDVTLHEAGKFCALALGGNPTVMELLWLPAWETTTLPGGTLVLLRERFLSRARVRDAYLGYATSQFHRLDNKGRFPDVPVARIEKHARHLLRLLTQGQQLWSTGQLTLRLDDPDAYFEFGTDVAAGNVERARKAIDLAEHAFDTTPSVLPERPDTDAVEEWLRAVRHAHYPHTHEGPFER